MSDDPFFGSMLVVPGLAGISLGGTNLGGPAPAGPPAPANPATANPATATAAPAAPVALSHDWRRWIAENLLLGQTTASMLDAMVRAGLEKSLATREVEAARNHPYLQAAAQAIARADPNRAGTANLAGTAGASTGRLAKREWVLEVFRRSAMLDPATAAVPVVRRPTREQFLHEFYAANRPALIEGAMDDWPALARWTLENLKQRFADRQVEIQAGRHADANYEINRDRHRREMRFGDYVELVRTGGRTNDYYMTGDNADKNRPALAELRDDVLPVPEYLRDEGPAATPSFWFGPAGTVTPLHHDLDNGLMAQVVGSKRVRLIAAADAAYVYNHHDRFSQVDPDKVDYDKFPLFRNARVLDVVLKPGQLLFVPAGWWHHVTALEVSMTLRFTNFVFENDLHSYYSTHGAV